MKITIEPTEDQSSIKSADCLYTKVSVEIPSDQLSISDAMEQAIKALQAWGFHNENIAEYLDEEFAYQLGLIIERPRKPTRTSSDEDKTSEYGGV